MSKPASTRNQISPEQARQATHCTKCQAEFTGSGYVVEKRDAGFGQQALAVVSVHEAAEPHYAHCRSCAQSYAKRQQRREINKRRNQLAKATKANLGWSDCSIVAVSTATGMPYSKVESLAKRLVGYKGQGLPNILWSHVLKVAAEKRGLHVDELVGVHGKSPAQLVDTYGTAGNLAISARLGGHGHAISATKGQLHNAGSGWATQATAVRAWLVTKA